MIVFGNGRMGHLCASIAPVTLIGPEELANRRYLNLKEEAIIDFSHPDWIEHILEYAVKSKTPLVIAATGHSIEQCEQIRQAAQFIPIIHHANFAPGFYYFLKMIKDSSLHGEVIINETHHRHKKDIPSGSALAIKKIIDAPINAKRVGQVVGEHSVEWHLEDEVVILTHSCTNRAVFAKGAIQTAKKLTSFSPGLYKMEDLWKM